MFAPTNPDLANILGDTSLDVEILFLYFVDSVFFQICRFPDFPNLALAGLGPGWARLEPSGPNNLDFLL